MISGMDSLNGVMGPQVQPPRVIGTRFRVCRRSRRATSNLVAGRACLTCGWTATAPDTPPEGDPQAALFGAEHLVHTAEACAARQRQRWAAGGSDAIA